MANDLNQCNFIGRLGRDPEMRYAPNGEAICNFSIACGWKTREKEGTEWVPVTTFGKLAEVCAQYLKKGSQVFISGRFTTRSWDDKEGKKRYTTEIRADSMQMLGGRQGSSGGDAGGYGGDYSQPAPQSSAPRRPQRPAATPPTGGGFGGMDDDIPF